MCSFVGCDALKIRAKGLCSKHYDELRMANMPPCSVSGCDNPGFARTLCTRHYQDTWYEPHPRPVKDRKPNRETSIGGLYLSGDFALVVDRLLAMTVRDGDCLRFTGNHNSDGYGTIGAGKRRAVMKAHRMMFHAAYDEAPISVHHTCNTRDCINPGHLQSVTEQENTAEMLERNYYLARIAELEGQLARR